ncbi:MAG TPA: GumC family protein [Candidatus Sulfotelmatobacter sp.]|nr:GumC family protein [Candidatus Sulfotelmatobacter sp.]
MNDTLHGYGHRPYSFTARDVAAIGFRHKRLLVLCFVGVVLGVALSAIFLPAKYRAETKLLVKRERVDPVITPDQAAPMTFHDTVSEEEINSEVELITSQDVLQKVVTTCGLDKKKTLSSLLHPWQTQQNRTDKAVIDLRSDLQLEVLKKTNVISIAYESKDPKLAQKVLATLNDAYLQKHLDVHHPSGQFAFFDEQAEKYKQQMLSAEGELKQFAVDQGGVAPTTQRDMTLQKLADFNGSLETTRASIAETEKRIADLESQSQQTPARLTTQMKQGDNAQVLENLKSTLLTLEMKRTELLTKYQPTYPLVVEVDKQISDTRSALQREETSPVKEETTDQNPTYAWVSSELSKAKADLSGFQAREAALVAIVNVYMGQAKKLEEQGLLQGDLTRTEKESEGNYLLYTKKKEEARIEDALDRTRLLNVSVVQNPALPSLPTRSPVVFSLVALLLASAISIGVVFAIDYTDQSFRTPTEVLNELRIPVLAAVPIHRNGLYSSNGNGNGNHVNGNGNGHQAGVTIESASSNPIIEERG